MRRAAALSAVLVLLGTAQAAAAAPADRPLRPALRTAQAQVDWTNLTTDERRRVLRRWNRAPALLDRLLDRIAPQLAIGRSTGAEIAQGNFTDAVLGDAVGAAHWQIQLSPVVLNQGGKLDAHLTLHELGHVVDGVLAGDTWREDLFAALARSPLWLPCWPMPQGTSSRCVRSNEIIADQFAFWATGRREVRSAYGDPPLLRRAALGAWFARLLPAFERDPRSYTVS